MITYQIYWIFYIVMLVIWTLFVYNWYKIMKKPTLALYFVCVLITTYIALGPLYSIFYTSYDIKSAYEYKDYQSQIIIPLEAQYNDILLPNGHYYAESKISDIKVKEKDNMYIYVYTFESFNNANSNKYKYTSSTLLSKESIYLLAMDSLATTDSTDDKIELIWECIN